MNVAASKNSAGDKNLAEIIKLDYATRLRRRLLFTAQALSFPTWVGSLTLPLKRPATSIDKRDGDGLRVTAILTYTVRTHASGLYEWM